MGAGGQQRQQRGVAGIGRVPGPGGVARAPVGQQRQQGGAAGANRAVEVGGGQRGRQCDWRWRVLACQQRGERGRCERVR
jgi:hypothetical protein